MIGPGKYDAECTLVRDNVKATGVVLLVLNGNRGSGMSAQLPADVAAMVPAMLRHVADEIERSSHD